MAKKPAAPAQPKPAPANRSFALEDVARTVELANALVVGAANLRLVTPINARGTAHDKGKVLRAAAADLYEQAHSQLTGVAAAPTSEPALAESADSR